MQSVPGLAWRFEYFVRSFNSEWEELTVLIHVCEVRIHHILLPSCESLYTERLSFTLQLQSPLELDLSHHPINRVNFLPPSIWPQDLSRLLQTANSMGRCSSSDIQTTAYLHLPVHQSDEVPWFGLVAYVIYLRGFSLYCYLRIDIPALALLKELRITF